MKTVSLKKLISIVAITIAFIIVLALTLVYVKYEERMDIKKGIDLKGKMTGIISVEPQFDIETTAGTIRVKLYGKTPQHLKNFQHLVEEHFYDSLLFHRVIDGFMIQTGDPYTKDSSMVELYGQGGPGYTLPAEFVPEYTHKKGALAAARRGDRGNPKKSSSGSQFYIVQDAENCMHLDGQYTVFGETVEGLDVIDKIAQVPTDPYDRPLEDIRIITVKPVLPDAEEVLDSAAARLGIDSTDISKLDSLAGTLQEKSEEELKEIAKDVAKDAAGKLKELGIDKKDLLKAAKNKDLRKAAEDLKEIDFK